MKVKDLIDILLKLDPELPVMQLTDHKRKDAWECDWEEISKPKLGDVHVFDGWAPNGGGVKMKKIKALIIE